MQSHDAPDLLVLPFANDVTGRNPIPTTTLTAGAASLTEGFPALTRTSPLSGGVPPDGLDMNGILYLVSALARWSGAGSGHTYDSTFATDPNVNGYPKGATVLATDGRGYWLNTVDDNVTDPETGGAGWTLYAANGIAAVSMSAANVTLSALQYNKPLIRITGTLSADLNLTFPTLIGQWTVINDTTGGKTVTCKTAAGSGVATGGGTTTAILGDGTNITLANRDAVAFSSTALYVPFANGSILQGGRATLSSSTTPAPSTATVTFAKPFANAGVIGMCSLINAGSGSAWIGTAGWVNAISKTQISLALVAPFNMTSPTMYWLALGY